MASAWGDSWGLSWGNAWGLLDEEEDEQPAGGAPPQMRAPVPVAAFGPTDRKLDPMRVAMLAMGAGLIR